MLDRKSIRYDEGISRDEKGFSKEMTFKLRQEVKCTNDGEQWLR